MGDQHAGLDIELGELEGDRLGGSQSAGVHRLEQRAVPQRRVARARGLCEQAVDLIAAEHSGQPHAGAGRPQVRGRVGIEQALSSQVPIERTQACDLALQGRGRGRPAFVAAVGELADELG